MGLFSAIKSGFDTVMSSMPFGIGQGYSNFLNYNAQVQNYAYQKEMQQEAWAREDSSLQRRIADAQAAGLNPQLALGSGASSSSPIQMTAPEMKSVDPMMSYMNFKSMMNSIQEQKNNIALQNQQKAMNNQQFLQNIQSLDEQALKLREQRHNLDYYTSRGLPTDVGGQVMQVDYLLSLIKNSKLGQKAVQALQGLDTGLAEGTTQNAVQAAIEKTLGIDAESQRKDSLNAAMKQYQRGSIRAAESAIRNKRELEKYKHSGQAEVDRMHREQVRKSGYYRKGNPWD